MLHWTGIKKPTYWLDGSDLRRSPVEVSSLSHYWQLFFYIPGGCLGFLNHQQRYDFPVAVGPYAVRPMEHLGWVI